jgi:serine/threonine protein phosphatase PrpC
MFAIYDGHGGADCCNFLKENFHSYVLNSYNEKDVRGSIKISCNKLDTDFFKKARTEYACDTSGSCALALLVIGRSRLIRREQPHIYQCR